VKLSLAGSVHDPNDPIGRLLFNVLAMVAEFETDLARTREGTTVAKAKGRLRGKQPKLKPTQQAHLVALWAARAHPGTELAELFGVTRSTVYRAIKRADPATAGPHVTSLSAVGDGDAPMTANAGQLAVDLEDVVALCRATATARHWPYTAWQAVRDELDGAVIPGLPCQAQAGEVLTTLTSHGLAARPAACPAQNRAQVRVTGWDPRLLRRRLAVLLAGMG